VQFYYSSVLALSLKAAAVWQLAKWKTGN